MYSIRHSRHVGRKLVLCVNLLFGIQDKTNDYCLVHKLEQTQTIKACFERELVCLDRPTLGQ